MTPEPVRLIERIERGAYGAAVAFIVFVSIGIAGVVLSYVGTISTDQASILAIFGLGLGIVAGYFAYRRVWTPRV